MLWELYSIVNASIGSVQGFGDHAQFVDPCLLDFGNHFDDESVRYIFVRPQKNFLFPPVFKDLLDFCIQAVELDLVSL